MRDQYDVWAGQVSEKLQSVDVSDGLDTFRAVVAAGLCGAAIEALDHAEGLVAQAAKKETHKDRRAGVAGARMVIRALSMAIKNPIRDDVKPLGTVQ